MKSLLIHDHTPWVSRAASWDVLLLLATAYVVLLPFQIELATEFRLAPSDGVLLLAVLLTPHQLRFRPRAWTVWHFGLVLAFAYGCFLTALTTGGLSRYVLLNKSVGLLFLLLTYTLITSVSWDWARIRGLGRWFVLSVSVQNTVWLVLFLISFVTGAALPGSYEGRRLCGMLIDPNAYGGLLVLALAISEGTSLGPRPLFGGSMLLFNRLTLSSGLLFTFSRTAWLSFVPVFLGLLVLRFRKAALTLVTVLVGLSVAGLLVGGRFLGWVQEMATRGEEARGRVELMQDALSEFVNHPFLGAGLGNFRAAEGTIVHNTPLWFLADLGAVGFLFFTGFALSFFAKGMAAYRLAPPEEKTLVTALLLGHAAMTTLSMGIEAFYQRHWWLGCALIASCYSVARGRVSQEATAVAPPLSLSSTGLTSWLRRASTKSVWQRAGDR